MLIGLEAAPSFDKNVVYYSFVRSVGLIRTKAKRLVELRPQRRMTGRNDSLACPVYFFP